MFFLKKQSVGLLRACNFQNCFTISIDDLEDDFKDIDDRIDERVDNKVANQFLMNDQFHARIEDELALQTERLHEDSDLLTRHIALASEAAREHAQGEHGGCFGEDSRATLCYTNETVKFSNLKVYTIHSS